MNSFLAFSLCGLLCAVWWTASLSCGKVLLLGIFLYWLTDVLHYRLRKGGAPGPAFTTPLGLGSMFAMIFRPIPFWERQTEYNRKGFSVNSMLGRFLVFVTDPQLCAKVFTHVDDYVMFAHPNARWLFGAENLIYMRREKHKAFRSLLIPGVYGKDALACYLRFQQRVCEKHLSRLAGAGEVDARLMLRLMTADASQESFLGPYLTKEQKDELSDDILIFTQGFLCFPLPLPFTGLGKAIRARHRILALLAPIAGRAKEYVAGGGKARCVMDFWAQEVVSRRTEGQPDVVSDDDMATTVLDFIFASQDATTSAVIWSLQMLTANTNGKEILEKLRREVEVDMQAQTPLEKLITPHSYAYTCATEMLRAQPPVPMVPHLTRRKAQLTETFSLPEGTMVIPSIHGAARHVPHAGVFDPDSGAKDPLFNDTLVFGAGQHKCPGRSYAVQQLAIFLAVLARGYVFERRITADSDKRVYLPTLFPKDNWYTFTKYQPLSMNK